MLSISPAHATQTKIFENDVHFDNQGHFDNHDRFTIMAILEIIAF